MTATQTETTPMTETQPAPEPLRLERETCSRCGGSGTYSWCYRYRDVCFKCGGKKEVLTKRGAAAYAYLKSLRSRRADELKVGDTIKGTGITMGGDVYDTWYKVEAIKATVTEGSMTVNGVVSHIRYDSLEIETGGKPEGCIFIGVPHDRMFEVYGTKAERLDTLRQAIAYQGTLTKAGTVRKTK